MAQTSPSDIASLSFQELRKECTKNGLTASGTTSVLRKRLRACLMNSKPDNDNDPEQPVEQEAEKPSKRQKRLEDDLICPITLELPIDPVTAEDGRSAAALYYLT